MKTLYPWKWQRNRQGTKADGLGKVGEGWIEYRHGSGLARSVLRRWWEKDDAGHWRKRSKYLGYEKRGGTVGKTSKT